MLADAVISHLSKLQSIVALSTYRAKYIAMCEAEKETFWLGVLLAELDFENRTTQLHCTLTIKA